MDPISSKIYQNRQRLGLWPELGKEAYNASPKSPIAVFLRKYNLTKNNTNVRKSDLFTTQFYF